MNLRVKVWETKVRCFGCVWSEAVKTGIIYKQGVERIADTWIDGIYGKRLRCKTDGSTCVTEVLK